MSRRAPPDCGNESGNNSGVVQNGVTISGNTIGGSLSFSASDANILSGVTISATGVVSGNNTTEHVTGNLTLNGTINIAGGSFLEFGETAGETLEVTVTAIQPRQQHATAITGDVARRKINGDRARG